MKRVFSKTIIALSLASTAFAGPSGHRVSIYNNDVGYPMTVRVWQYDVKRKESSSFDIYVPANGYRTEHTANLDTHMIGYSFNCNGSGNIYYSVHDDYTNIPKTSLLIVDDKYYEKGGMSLRSSSRPDQGQTQVDLKFYPYFD